MQQVLAAVNGTLASGTYGLAVKVAALASAGGTPNILSNFVFTPWALDTPLKDARSPNINVRPRTWTPITKQGDVNHRDARAVLEVTYEYFGGVLIDIQNNLAIVATGLAQSLDNLRTYSDANAGTVIELLDGTTYQFGPFGPTSNGFIATITILERSAQ